MLAAPIGTVTAVSEQPSKKEIRAFLDNLDPTEIGGPMQAAVVRAFQRIYHRAARRTWHDVWYRGTRLHIYPTDLWIYQELVEELKPSLVVQTGTFRGGTALFLADRMQTIGRGHVVTIDAEAEANRPQHPRLTYLTGPPTATDIVEEVRSRLASSEPALFLLGAGTTKEEVLAELQSYAPLAPTGSVVVVEHTHLDGPAEALHEFLGTTSDFEVDARGDRHFLTQNPSGLLRRVAGESEAGAAASPASLDLDATTPAVRALDSLVFDGDTPHVVLVLQAFEPHAFFAGIKTAVLAAARLAAELGHGLRVVVVQPARTSTHDEAAAALGSIVREAGLADVAASLRLSTPMAQDPGGHTSDDVWVATYWTTAWALKTLARAGRVAHDLVVYLIQDFEPGFYPWGPLYAKAYSTYDAGFRPLVNSASLAKYVADISPTTPDVAFAPALDLGPLHAAAEKWRPGPDGEVRVLFYARPGKPRNMYAAGLEALRLWAEQLPDGLTGVVRFAGEEIADEVELGPRARVEMLGKLSYDGYHDLLADSDVGLALMLSPHPGHLALELPLAGIPTVTNDFAGYREEWVTGLTVSGTDPTSIADALASVTESARGLTEHVPHDFRLDLGVSLEQAVSQIARGLRSRSADPDRGSS
jgi:cephalosporin hydroxylase